jgi:hypothetical protein
MCAGPRSLSDKSKHAVYAVCIDYPNKEQSNDSNGTDVWSDSSGCGVVDHSRLRPGVLEVVSGQVSLGLVSKLL